MKLDITVTFAVFAWYRRLLQLLAVAGLTITVAFAAADSGQSVDPGIPEVEQDVQLGSTAAQYDAEIADLESLQGAYGEALGENLLGLGLIYQQQGNHAAARKALGRAMHIRRVNEGLQCMSQLALLENLMDSNIALGDWAALEQNFKQMVWVYRRNFAPDDPEFIHMLAKLGRWKVEIFRSTLLGSDSVKALAEAEELFGKTINYVEEQHGKTDPRLIELLYGRALMNYQLLLDTANRPLSDFQSTGLASTQTHYVRVCFPTPRGTVCGMEARTTPIYDKYFEAQQQKDDLIRTYRRNIVRSLEQILAISEINPELSSATNIHALVKSEDWSLPQSRNLSEREKYLEADAMLIRLGLEQAKVDRLFGKEPADEGLVEAVYP
jgi:tetratricopeptide (TPR) repeat protein